ncbi:MAG: alpha/beta fold hydrolase [Huintestinicola sp.]
METIKTESTFISSNGIDSVHYYVYTSGEGEAQPKAVIQILHGMCEHAENYEEFIERLCGRGYAVIMHDFLGHGKTAADDRDLGFFALKYGWIYLVRDARTVTVKAHEIFPGIPVYLIGHSMGSLVARAYMSKYSHDIEGAVLMGTVGRHMGAPAGIIMADAEIYLHGEKSRSKTISRILYDLGNIRISNRHCNMDWVSRDEKAAARYVSDKKSNFIFTASAYRDVFMLLEYCSSSKWYGRVRKDIPMLIMSGSDDPVGAYGRGAADLWNCLIKHGFTKTEIRIWDGCRHELLHELNKDEVMENVIGWLDRHNESN